MLIDTDTLSEGRHFETELCILGAGAAGITLARELEGAGKSVLLVESGGFQSEESIQSLYRGEVLLGEHFRYDEYLTASRLRYFGGTTNHWAGFCRPLDAEDFAAWPISRGDLEPFYRRAADYVEIGPLPDDSRPAAGALFSRFQSSKVLRAQVLPKSPPTRFGTSHRSAITSSSRIGLVLPASVTELVTGEDGRAVTRAQLVSSRKGTRFSITAKTFVLALGAIENARVLLHSRGKRGAAIGNEHDLVGRFFMDHLLSYDAAVAALGVDPFGAGSIPVLALVPDVRKKERMLNVRFHFERMAKPPPEAAEVTRLCAQAGVDDCRHFCHIGFQVETAPDRENRVTLSDKTDRWNTPLVKLKRTAGEAEARTIATGLALLAQELGRLKLGRLRLPASPEKPLLSFHHLGTTRMARNPTEGVVDADCRVHGVRNLFVAGSSVFVTSGAQNPTLTLLALAIRLGDYLRRSTV